jgi:uncharacterized membrane protein
MKGKRAWELDLLRGICILLVVWDHTCFNMMYYAHDWAAVGGLLAAMGEFGAAYWYSTLRRVVKPFVLFLFFFISGICTQMTKNNLFRGLKLAAVAGFITLGTLFLDRVMNFDGVLIKFGVIHCLAACILIFSAVNLLNYALPKYKKQIFAGVCAALAVTAVVLDKVYNVSGTAYEFEGAMVRTDNILAGLFVYTPAWVSADYFPLLPLIFLIFFGSAVAEPVLDRRLPDWFYRVKPPVLPFLGRHTLIIYLAHQPILYGVFMLWQ